MTTSALGAAASRRNGARSRGPVSAAGKARSAQNATRHGLRAQSLLLSDESAHEFAALAGALRAELAPRGALQSELALRVAAAAWRARRADRVEAAVLERHLGEGGGRHQRQAALGAALIRDGRAVARARRAQTKRTRESWRNQRPPKRARQTTPGRSRGRCSATRPSPSSCSRRPYFGLMRLRSASSSLAGSPSSARKERRQIERAVGGRLADEEQHAPAWHACVRGADRRGRLTAAVTGQAVRRDSPNA
jgi:hypothetical protein